MKKLKLVLLGVIALMSIQMTSFAQRKTKGDMERPHQKVDKEAGFEKMATELELTTEQKEQMKSIQEKNKEKMKAMRENQTELRKKSREEMESLKKENQDELKAILTKDQYIKYLEMKQGKGDRAKSRNKNMKKEN